MFTVGTVANHKPLLWLAKVDFEGAAIRNAKEAPAQFTCLN